ncbi:MAG: Permease of the drug/metabolite transporter (DMT) superfamily [Burkholderiaceae bacterium]|jgi:drug/metabolite transporter (DMT)-like permease|nr:MAG: Permease of the drug/metabolite transporter (DMT) superfamily [Burkholderiaceae bacterium]
MPSASRKHLATALIFIVPALWSVNYLIARRAPGVIAPNLLAGERWLMAGAAFCFVYRGELWAARRAVLADWRHMLVLGALGMWICGAWVYLGGQTTSATNIALIYSLSPVMIVVVSRLWLREPFSLLQGCGVALALAGVVHVVLKGEWTELAKVHWVVGDLWILAATLSWTFFSILLKRWTTPLSDGARLGAVSLAGVLVILPFAAWEAVTGPQPAFSRAGFELALAGAVLPGYAAYLAYSMMLRVLGAARVSVVLYLGPLYAAVMAWLVLGEPIHAYHAVGLALVLPGIYLVNRKPDAVQPE